MFVKDDSEIKEHDHYYYRYYSDSLEQNNNIITIEDINIKPLLNDWWVSFYISLDFSIDPSNHNMFNKQNNGISDNEPKPERIYLIYSEKWKQWATTYLKHEWLIEPIHEKIFFFNKQEALLFKLYWYEKENKNGFNTE